MQSYKQIWGKKPAFYHDKCMYHAYYETILCFSANPIYEYANTTTLEFWPYNLRCAGNTTFYAGMAA